MLVHIWRLPNNVRIPDQLNHLIEGASFRVLMLADCIMSIGVPPETEFQQHDARFGNELIGRDSVFARDNAVIFESFDASMTTSSGYEW